MKLPDINVWLALTLSGHEHFERASAWLAEQQSHEEVAFCRMTQLAFLRLLTTRGVLSLYGNPPLSNSQAQDVYEQLVAGPRIAFVAEPPGLDPLWKVFSRVPSPSPKLWMDAYLAAFAVAGGHQLVTIDSGFKQFKGLDLLLLR